MYNYSKNILDKMAAETGFIRDPLEKVFRLCDALRFLNNHSTTRECLALKGGTAINLTVFNLPRLSIDIHWIHGCFIFRTPAETATISKSKSIIPCAAMFYRLSKEA